jgi:hypothetical protein
MKTFKQYIDEKGRCWPGHKPVPGKKPYSPGSCMKESAAAAIAAATAISKKKSGDYDSKGFRKTKYKNPDSPNIKSNEQRRKELAEDLRKWFAQKWVRMDTKGNIKGDCARDPGEGKPKCLPQAKAQALGKEGRASAARRKRREDPNPERRGAPINVRTK